MVVFEVKCDPAYQRLYPVKTDPRASGVEWNRFACKSRKEDWNPPPFYVLEPLKPRGDFTGFSCNLVVRDSAYQKIHRVFDVCCEMLPIDFEGERWWAINPLHCFNVLDYERTIWNGVPGKSSIKKHTFHSYRMTEMPLFRIPEEISTSVLLAQGAVHEEYDLKNLCERHGLTGLQFKELWRNE